MAALREVIDALEHYLGENEDKEVRWGFNGESAHSYRGYYSELAFEPAENVLISSMLAGLKDALGKTYQGYKGGDYKMHEWVDVWIAHYGSSADSDQIGPTIMRYWLAEAS